jgi:hypothetical protein
MEPEDYMSFLVRLWRDQPGNEPDTWRGEIEQIQTGIRRHFSTHSELFAFLHQLVIASQVIAQPASEDPCND